ncbi:MAG TPA: RagB/SusD family nutrient uptake outer membrane protein, partial [Pedobacter sp.]
MMERSIKIYVAALMICCLFSLSGCEKFLEEKTSKKLAVPTTLADFQALLDQSGTMSISSPGSGEISADDYYLTDAKWACLTAEGQRRMYTWEKDNLYSNSPDNDWTYVYKAVYTCNTVLSGLKDLPRTSFNATEWDNVKGQALFCRGNNFLDAAIVWCLAYDKNTAGADLGLPLKMSIDFNETYTRSNVQQTYERIIMDLKAAVPLLPVVPLSNHRPSKAGAYGMISRAYMAMMEYHQAELYADSCLALNHTIMDYNTLTVTANYPITKVNNTEGIYFRYLQAVTIIYNATPITPKELYDAYLPGDLRKAAYFRMNADGTYYFKGSYAGSSGPFSGIATDEMYFNKAECLARKGNVSESMDLLNTLLIKRWDKT